MTAEELERAGDAFRKGLCEAGGDAFKIETPTDAAFVALTFQSMGGIGAQLLTDSTPEKRAEAVRKFRVRAGKGVEHGRN